MSQTSEVDTEWLEKYSGTIEPRGASPPVAFGIPADFGGKGGEWTPEHFLAAAVTTCIQSTFLTVVNASGIALKSYASSAGCTMAKGATGFEVTGVTVAPHIVVADEKSKARAERAIEKAERLCPISKTLGALVTLKARVDVEA